MLTGKKKRVALEMHRRNKTNQTRPRLWSILSSAVNRIDSGGESKCIFFKKFTYFLTTISILDINQLRMEIYGLEELLRQLFLEINYLKNMQERQKWSQTLQGKYFNVIGHFFSVYCLWKIFIVSKLFSP